MNGGDGGWYGIDLGVCVHVLYVIHNLKKRGQRRKVVMVMYDLEVGECACRIVLYDTLLKQGRVLW